MYVVESRSSLAIATLVAPREAYTVNEVFDVSLPFRIAVFILAVLSMEGLDRSVRFSQTRVPQSVNCLTYRVFLASGHGMISEFRRPL